MTNTNMAKLITLWNFLTLMALRVSSLDIKMDPGMREGEHSYIYCDVGTVTAGVIFYTEPGNVQGSCIVPGQPCSSTLYNMTADTSGVFLEITSVNVTREEGAWYCLHDTDRSNTIMVNNQTIAGILLRQDWPQPSGPVDTFSAAMTLSCTNKVPDFSFTFEDSESNTGTVPPEAVSTTNLSSYDGTTCENGNKFYVITLNASNSLDVFNNKQGVKFSFTYYDTEITAPVNVNFTAFIESTTESPNTTATSVHTTNTSVITSPGNVIFTSSGNVISTSTRQDVITNTGDVTTSTSHNNTTSGDNLTTDEVIMIVFGVVGGLVVAVLVVVLVHKYCKKKVHSQDRKKQAMTTPAEPKRISSNL